ncbi:ComEA family DNA-binding protein, partial [Candidatus Cloacimonadota bacterium]
MNYHKNKIIFLIILVPVLYNLKAEQSWLEEDTIVFEEIPAELLELKEDPLDINCASISELSILPWLNELHIERIIEYRKMKSIRSKKQLADLGIDEISLEEMSDYITYRPKNTTHFSNYFRLELARSKLKEASCTKTFSRSIITKGNWEAGFVTQKDEGERDPLDFYSYYLTLKNAWFIRNLILGKFRIYSGLGCLLSSKLGGSKTTTYSGSQIKNRTAIKPYTSSYECWEMEGFCSELQFGKFRAFPFLSLTSLSANLVECKISSFNETGIHLDPAKKDNVKENIFGLISEYSGSAFLLNLTGYHLSFDHKFTNPAIQQRFTALSLTCELFRSSFPITMELCWSENKFSWLGILSLRSETLRQQLILRSYSNGFPSWHG